MIAQNCRDDIDWLTWFEKKWLGFKTVTEQLFLLTKVPQTDTAFVHWMNSHQNV